MTSTKQGKYQGMNNIPMFHKSFCNECEKNYLGHFSNIGRLYNLGILIRDDLNYVKYEFLAIYQNQNIQAYLTFLNGWFKLRQINNRKFEDFRLPDRFLKEITSKYCNRRE